MDGFSSSLGAAMKAKHGGTCGLPAQIAGNRGIVTGISESLSVSVHKPPNGRRGSGCPAAL